MKMYSYTERDLEGHATQIKNVVIDFLHKEGILTDEQQEKYTTEYAFIFRKPTFFDWLFKGKEKDSLLYYIVKNVSMRGF